MKDWTKAFFRTPVFFPGDPTHVSRAPKEVAFAIRALGLRKGDSLLDVCCGTGRHSLRFARKGLRVTGVDATPEYLSEARRLASGRSNPRYLHGDMRRLPFRSEFDAAVNFWTSFGYFPKLSDDLKTLKGVARSLKPGGRFLIDIIDADYLRRNGLAKNWSFRDDGSILLEDFKMHDGRDPYQTNTWTIVRPGKKTLKSSFFVRSYDFDRLSKMLRKAGLVPVKRWGGPQGTPYVKGVSSRLVILAKKPGGSHG